jgi:hypothetical protein
MQQTDLFKAILPGIIVGGALYIIGTFLSPILGPGWGDILHGLGGLVGLILVGIGAFGVLRRASAERSGERREPDQK